MRQAWKRIDLEGGGLQAANRRLAATLRSRRTAYLLWLACAVGAHRFYLRSPVGGLAWCVASAATLALWRLGTWPGVAAGLALLVWALADLRWSDRRVTALNKALRMAAYLGAGPGAPPGYRGRFVDGGEAQDSAAQPPPRAPGFAEQARLLGEIERRKRHTD